MSTRASGTATTALLLLTLVAPWPVNASSPTVYVAPRGEDAAAGTSAGQPVATLERARALARALNASSVSVAPGVYRLQRTLELGPADSGVAWVASGLVSVSGGVQVTGWHPVPLPSRPGLRLVRAPAPPGLPSRHFFVNGLRASRTRMAQDIADALFAGAVLTDEGVALRSPAGKAGASPLPAGSEFVYPQSTSPWTEPRCAVLRANASFVLMAQPCWLNLMHKACGQGAKGTPNKALDTALNATSVAARVTPTAGASGGAPGSGRAGANGVPMGGHVPLAGIASPSLGAPSGGRGYVENVGWEAIRAPGEWSYGDGYIYYSLREGEGGAARNYFLQEGEGVPGGDYSIGNGESVLPRGRAASALRERRGMLQAGGASRSSVPVASEAERPSTRFIGGAHLFPFGESVTKLPQAPPAGVGGGGVDESFAVASGLGGGGGNLEFEAVVPLLEVLLRIRNASDVSFTGFSFEHATWRRPAGPDGFVEQQSGCGPVGSDARNSQCGADEIWSQKTPGNVQVISSRRIAFRVCVFTRLGAVALDLTEASDCVVERCVLRDVSAAAIQVGGFLDPLSGWRDRNNTIRDCLIEEAAAELSGAAGINVGYTVGSRFEHNTLRGLAFSGISVGWGWDHHACDGCSDARDNRIASNRIERYKTRLNDGGGIYMLGPQNGSVVSDNFISQQGTASCGALYPDEGSSGSLWQRNVVTQIGNASWLHLWTASIRHVRIIGNFADTSRFLNQGTECPMLNNFIFEPGHPPPEAEDIMRAAGVRTPVVAAGAGERVAGLSH